MGKYRSLEHLGLFFIALLIAVGGVFSTKLLSIILPALTILVIWKQGGIKTVSLPPPFIFLLLILGWGGLSVLWAIQPTAALKTFMALSATFVFALLLTSNLKQASPEIIAKAYSLILISGFLIILFMIFETYSDALLIKIFRHKKEIPLEQYALKSSASVIGLSAFVGCAFLWVHNQRILALFSFLLFLLLTHLSMCQTAIYALWFGSFVFILSYLMPFWTTRIALISTYTFSILAPVLFFYIFPPAVMIQSSYLKWIVNSSFFHRLLAWEFASEKFFERPLLGWGVESTRYLSSDKYLAEGYERVIHPHSNSLQAYVELGIVGGILYALFYASLFWLVEKKVKDRLSVAVCNATLAFGFIACQITHNAWRNYWLSWVAITAGLIILFLKARAAQLHAEVDHSEPNPAL